MRTALDPLVLAFKRDRANAAPFELNHYARLYWDDPLEFGWALNRAWEQRRPGPLARLWRIADLNAGLGVKWARRLAQLLLYGERHAETLELLHDARFGLLQDAEGQFTLARTLLGSGEPQAAVAAAARAAELDAAAEKEAAAVAAAAAPIMAAQPAAAGAMRWSGVRPLVDAYLGVGAAEAAARALAAFLGRGAVEAEELPDIHALIDAIVSVTGPGWAANLFCALERHYGEPEARADLRRISSVLLGEERAPLDAAFRTPGLRLRASGALAWARAGELEAAIPLLGELTFEFPKDPAARIGLSRAIGKDLLGKRPFRLTPPRGQRKIFDLFLFRDELRILKIKLHEMADWVDHFVIVEARQSHAGADKPLVFQENRDQFSAFEDKIIHVVVDAFPPYVRHPWAREMYQRDSGLFALDGLCGEDDLLIISDTDEIVSGAAVKNFKGGFASIAMERAELFLNHRRVSEPEDQKETSSLWRASYLPSLGLSYARITLRADKKAPRLTGAGWHFTSIAGTEGIIAKLTHQAHQEHAGTSERHVADALEQLRQGRFRPGWERCELDERFPAYIRENREEFADMLL